MDLPTDGCIHNIYLQQKAKMGTYFLYVPLKNMIAGNLKNIQVNN